MILPEVNLEHYRYLLPEDKIPDRPLPERDLSKLLLYADGNISHSLFKNLKDFLPADSFLVFNNSKVIPARLFFQNENGSRIEVLCLQEVSKEIINEHSGSQQWKCIIGNLKRWKEGSTLSLQLKELTLSATLAVKQGEQNIVAFSWNKRFSFLEILEEAGKIPLPPYMNRNADSEDKIRYQTVYAQNPGSVAAPTAGLHFTDRLLKDIKTEGHQISYITLHVGAGTFKPIKSDKIADHQMHEEIFETDLEFLEKLAGAEKVIPVGTTSMRTLESLCILGEKLKTGEDLPEVHQWDGFLQEKIPSAKSLSSLIFWMKQNEKTTITVKTSIMIVPGYQFRICKGLITNFHQPESTLILLVAAFLGEKWKNVYNYALENEFRFLSYGDSSLLLP